MVAIGSAQSTGEANIRGLDVKKIALGFADELSIFKKHVINQTTSARLIRWYQRSTGLLSHTSPATSAISELSLPFVLRRTVTRNESQVRVYAVDSDWISNEDERDNDISIFAMLIKDLVNHIERQVDSRIYNVISEDQSAVNINSRTATAAWGASSGVNILRDITGMKQQIRENGYFPDNGVLALNSLQHRLMLEEFVNTRGASFTGFSSDRIVDGVIDKVANMRIIVSQNVVSGSACMWIPDTSATWFSFMDLDTAIIEEPLIGKKIRVKMEGEAILHDPKSVTLLTGIGA